jgi:hypothetical protein
MRCSIIHELATVFAFFFIAGVLLMCGGGLGYVLGAALTPDARWLRVGAVGVALLGLGWLALAFYISATFTA